MPGAQLWPGVGTTAPSLGCCQHWLPHRITVSNLDGALPSPVSLSVLSGKDGLNCILKGDLVCAPALTSTHIHPPHKYNTHTCTHIHTPHTSATHIQYMHTHTYSHTHIQHTSITHTTHKYNTYIHTYSHACTYSRACTHRHIHRQPHTHTQPHTHA